MQVGNFNLNSYMEKLNEAEETGGVTGDPKEGLIIPAENKKTYDWLKKEYNSGKTEVKVEMRLGGSKFEPGYDFTAGGDTIKNFKPGMYGEVKTSENSKTSEGGLSTSTAKKPKTESAEGSEAPKKAKKDGVQIKGASTSKASKVSKKKKEEDNEENDE